MAFLGAGAKRRLGSVLTQTFDLQFHDSACLQFVVWMKIPDILGEKPEGVPVDEVAAKIGVEKDKVARILRFLSTKHIFTEGK